MQFSFLIVKITYRYFKMKHGDATEHAIPLVSSLGFLLIFEYLILIAHDQTLEVSPLLLLT